MSLADLRKRSDSDFGKITAALTKKADYSKDDEGFWKPTQDKAGNATATIRFLPAHQDDDLFYVDYWTHSFQHGGKGGKWFIDNCPTSVGRDECPVCAINKQVYSTMPKAEAQKIAGSRTRKKVYISNILVIKDPANPENEGKVFRFKYGKKIMEKIEEKLTPIYDDITPVRVYDIDNGADFRLIMTIEDKYPSYAKSFFGDKKPISDNDDEIQRVIDDIVSLKQFVAPEKFKSAEELQKRLDYVMGNSTTSTQKAEEAARTVADEIRNAPKSAPKEKTASAPKEKEAPAFDDVPDGEDLEKYFAGIAE